MKIFRANDVRGVYGAELKDEDAYKLGYSFAQFLKAKEVVVARDNRLSSPALSKALIKGLLDAGANVTDIGIIDSPGLYFASHYFNKPAIMVTASHNPAQHNGFYLCKSDGVSLYHDNGLGELEKLFRKIKTENKAKNKRVMSINIKPLYEKHILSFINKNKIKKMKIVIDSGNGVGAIMASRVYDNFPQIKIIPLYFESDGGFPNRSPDSSMPKNLAKLSDRVKKEKADFGFAFDGDADRAAFVDNNGWVIEGSIMGALLADYLLSKSKKKEKIIYSIGCSKIVQETILKHKGIPIRDKVGHSFINAAMRNNKALFGIEHTGHYFYRDNFYTESAIITSLIACEMLSKSDKKLSSLVNPYRKYYMTGEISFPAKNQRPALERIKKELARKYNAKIETFDGLFLDLGNYWFRVRASQTEPLIRLAIEGKSKKIVDKVKEELAGLIKQQI